MSPGQSAVPRDTVEAAIQRYYAAINARQPAAIAGVFAPDGVFHYPGRPPLHGRAAIEAAEQQILAPINTITLTPEETYIDGPRAAVKFGMRVRTRDGGSASMEGIDTFVVNPDGTLQQVDVYYDARALVALTTS